MYLDTAFIKTKSRIYKRVLLRNSYRENGKVKHKTIANLSGQSDETIEAIRFALKNKSNVQQLLINNSKPIIGYSFAALFILYEISKRLHINDVLGNSRNAKLALWQIFARIIDQGSRLSAVRLAEHHAVCEILNLDSFNEDALYQNLKWMADNQEKMEIKLFEYKNPSKTNLFLYDVTSSYIEGEYNEYANFGYNRDKKKGKKQIVIGLLTDCEGDPVSVQVFKGNTTDSSTFVEQVYKVCEKFRVLNVIFVGDRGMIKKPQIDNLPKFFSYITAITKPEIHTLIKTKIITIEDFSDQLHEIRVGEIRYILKKNPIRAREIEANRESKFINLQKAIEEKNNYLKGHPKASSKIAIKTIKAKAEKLNIDKWVVIIFFSGKIVCKKKLKKLKSESMLDGCYVLKSNSIENSSEIIHERYKDLKYVENAFRTMKSMHLEIRPYYVRKEASTEGHVFIVMLAYKIIRYLREEWSLLNTTVEEGINILSSIRGITNEEKKYQTSPKLDCDSECLIKKLNIELPSILPMRSCVVATRKTLAKRN